MARPAQTNVATNSVAATVQNPGKPFHVVSAIGHTLTVYSDGAVYDETAGRFALASELKRG